MGHKQANLQGRLRQKIFLFSFLSGSTITFAITFRRKGQHNNMKEVRNITQKVIILLTDILFFTCQVVRKVILPNRRRKGNVLSSLLTFFVGLLERVVSFERNILRRPVVFPHKYVRQALMVAVGLLVLLSSLEWTIAPDAGAGRDSEPSMVACEQVSPPGRTTVTRRISATVATQPVAPTAAGPVYDLSQALTGDGAPVTARKWLRFRVLRI